MALRGQRTPAKSDPLGPPDRRVQISNIPYELKWQELKDLFKNEVGDVAYVEIFEDPTRKGKGVVEFKNEGAAKKAVEKLHRYDIKSRHIVVKRESEIRGKDTRPSDGWGMGSSGLGLLGGSPMAGGGLMDMGYGGLAGGCPSDMESKYGSTFGLNTQFLQSLGINGPLVCRLFVANLDYNVDEKKLKDVFRLAGKVMTVDLHKDKDGKSKGYGIVEMEHPVEAVQAISMFAGQSLYDRKMTVKMDSTALKDENTGPTRLPPGLKSVGMGLGSGGAPLRNVANAYPTSGSGGSATNSYGNGTVNNGTGAGSDTIIVRNLPVHYTWQHLKARFSEFGDVRYTEMRDQGVGVIRFGSEREARRAINMMDRTRVEGRLVEVYLY